MNLNIDLKYYKKIIIVTICIIVGLYLIIFNTNRFGTIVGNFNGVNAYSNQKGETECSDPNYYNGLYTGIKWQCVEYARRYLQITRGITFDNVDYAFQIPQANFTSLNGKNVQKTNDIKIGSLVIWPKYYKNNAPDGHVAVISSIHQNGIYVAEQNYDDKTFPRFIDWNDLNNVTIIYALYF